jgi:flagellar motility protein MotE (MotC chaperone)
MKFTPPAPRLLPLTIVALAALLVLKSVVLVRAAAPLTAAATPAAASPAATTPAATTPAAATPSLAATAVPCRAEATGPIAPPISDAERKLLLDLRGRRAELDARAHALSVREATLGAAEKQLALRVQQLDALQKRLEALDAERKAHEEANWKGLVKLYSVMKPRDAATIFNDLDLNVLLPVLDRMQERNAAPILADMQPARARLVTAELAKIRLQATTPAAP